MFLVLFVETSHPISFHLWRGRRWRVDERETLILIEHLAGFLGHDVQPNGIAVGGKHEIDVILLSHRELQVLGTHHRPVNPQLHKSVEIIRTAVNDHRPDLFFRTIVKSLFDVGHFKGGAQRLFDKGGLAIGDGHRDKDTLAVGIE